MNTPKKCGNLYVQFDENNRPEYAFKVKADSWNKGNYIIQEFIPMCDKKFDTVVLPKLVNDQTTGLLFGYKLENYVDGTVHLGRDLFKGFKNIKIVVPFNNSISFADGCFENASQVEFVIPEGLGFKSISRRTNSGFDYIDENWFLIADKKLNAGDLAGFVADYAVESHQSDVFVDNHHSTFTLSRVMEDVDEGQPQ